MDNCDYCAYAFEKGFCPIFDLKCEKCRERALLTEPCKMLRQYMAEDMGRKFDVPNWKVEPHCGCKRHCKRHTSNQESRYKEVKF